MNAMEFSPDGSWLAVINDGALTFWNLAGHRSTVLGRQKAPYVVVAFTPDGHLLSSSDEGVLRRWPLSPAGGEDVREYRLGAAIGMSVDLDRQGRFAVLPDRLAGKVLVVPFDGAEPVSHPLKDGRSAYDARVDPSGRFVAVWAGNARSLRILDLNTRTERILDTRAEGEGCVDPAMGGVTAPVWLPDGRLVTDGPTGLNVWNLATGVSEQLRPCWRGATSWIQLLATPDSRAVLRLDAVFKIGQASSLVAFDLASRKIREIGAHGNSLRSFALDATGTILVTGDTSGIVRVGPLTGEGPHLLFGHTAAVTSVAVSPDGRWIASGGDDGAIRLWPMPDLSKPPLHTLPHGELLAKLRSLTNLRAVRDQASDTGWKLEVGPFRGWAVVPTWQP
jgi:WD40 repeat protein